MTGDMLSGKSREITVRLVGGLVEVLGDRRMPSKLVKIAHYPHT